MFYVRKSATFWDFAAGLCALRTETRCNMAVEEKKSAACDVMEVDGVSQQYWISVLVRLKKRVTQQRAIMAAGCNFL